MSHPFPLDLFPHHFLLEGYLWMYIMMNWFGRNFVETRVGPLDNTTRHCRGLTVITLWVNGLLEMFQFHWWRLCFHYLADAHECVSFNCAPGICIFLALSPCFKLLRKTWALIQLPLLVMGESFLCCGRPLRVAVRATVDTCCSMDTSHIQKNMVITTPSDFQ